MQSKRIQTSLEGPPVRPVASTFTDHPAKPAKARRVAARTLKDYRKLVNSLETRAHDADRACASAALENETLKRKIAIQRHLIEHLRNRLETVTGLEIEQSVNLAAGDSVSTMAVSVHQTLPPIDPSEFLPIDEAPRRLQVVETLLGSARNAAMAARSGAATIEQQCYCLLNRARASRLFAD